MKKKSGLTICLDMSPAIPCLDNVLESIFWRDRELCGPARDYLLHVKRWGMTSSPCLARDWKSYCSKSGLTQSQYHNMLKRLRKAGLVVKTYNRNTKSHELRLCGDYSKTLGSLIAGWDEFLGPGAD